MPIVARKSGTVFFQSPGMCKSLQHQILRLKHSQFTDSAGRLTELL
jgi:hypothetical protein